MNLHRKSIDVHQNPVLGLMPASISVELKEQAFVLEETCMVCDLEPGPPQFFIEKFIREEPFDAPRACEFGGFTLLESASPSVFERLGNWWKEVAEKIRRLLRRLG